MGETVRLKVTKDTYKNMTFVSTNGQVEVRLGDLKISTWPNMELAIQASKRWCQKNEGIQIIYHKL